MIRYKCEKCKSILESDDVLVGKVDQCPVCKASFVVPYKSLTGSKIVQSKYKCSECNLIFTSSNNMAGKKCICPYCQTKLSIPGVKKTKPESSKSYDTTKSTQLDSFRNKVTSEDLCEIQDFKDTLKETMWVVSGYEQKSPSDIPSAFDIELVEDLWNSFFSSVIATTTTTFSQLMPCVDDYIAKDLRSFFNKWNLPEHELVDWPMFDSFRAELGLVSDKYEDWGQGSLTIEGYYETAVWKKHFFPLLTEVSELNARIQNLISKKNRRKQTLSSSEFNLISPYEFENILAMLFQRMNYDTEVTPSGGDYGIDVIARKGHIAVAIQAKKYSIENKVGNRDVQRLLGAMQHSKFNADRAILITTSDFTPQARKQAIGTSVELWDGVYLARTMQKYNFNPSQCRHMGNVRI